MPKRSIDREYYRNGQIRQANREVDGRLHGLSRSWHPNGQLAEERRYDHGNLHGTSRQWNENGRLLGSFSMKHGTGRQRHWHNNGQMRLETDCLDGKFFGRMRIWLMDGTLVQETYYLSNVAVTRATYLKARKTNWPQYQRETSERVARQTPALKRKQHELFIQSLLKKTRAEAKAWFAGGKSGVLHSLAGFRTSAAALRFVDDLSAVGADRIIVAPIYQNKRGKLFADSLLVKLPRIFSKRKTVRRVCRDLCRQSKGALLPEKDIGESHLFLGLA